MVGRFSKMRAALFVPNRIRSYLLYAIGEVVLIVLGILVAIQLNDGQQQRYERGLERNYIENLLSDLRLDIVRSDVWFGRFEQKLNGLRIAKDFYFGDFKPDDSDSFFSDVSIGGAGSRGRILQDAATYEELISTGNLRYIRSDVIFSAR